MPAVAARSKNLGIYDDMIYFGAPDGFLLALDAQTGKLRWETKVDNGQITAGGLLVADGKVISNRTCEQGKREFCFIAAHDAKTGKEVWKFYVTAAPGDAGGDTWGNVPVDQRAAGPWGLPGSYDPVRKVVYWGVANPNPYTRFKRHGKLRHRRSDVAHRAVQQFNAGARTSRPASWSGTPGAAWRRLGRGPQPGAHSRSHACQPGPAVRQMDQPGMRRAPPNGTS